MKSLLKKIFRRVGIVILTIITILAIVPYLIPITAPVEMVSGMPYENSVYLSIANTAFHIRIFEPVTMPVKGKILMIHGMGGSTYSYEKTVPALIENGYYVVLVDLPGFGYSERVEEYDHSQSNRSVDLWQLLDGIDRNLETETASQKWNLVGHSMGGGTIAAMAVQETERTECITFIDGALFETARSNPLFNIGPVQRWIQVILEHALINEKNIASFLSSAYGRAPTDSEVRGYLEPLSVPGTARAATGLILAAKNIDPELLSKLTIPIYGIWGENDSWVPVSEADKLKEIMPQLQLYLIAGAGHCPMETHSEQFNQVLLSFLHTN